MSTTLVAPHCAGTSCICGKIKKSNVLHYICHFTSDKNNFLYSWLFFSLTWAENEHWQPLVALRPLEAVKSFISCPCDTGKQPLIPKIVSDTGKMTNEWSKVLLFLKKIWVSKWPRIFTFTNNRLMVQLWSEDFGGPWNSQSSPKRLYEKIPFIYLLEEKMFFNVLLISAVLTPIFAQVSEYMQSHNIYNSSRERSLVE